jgi:N,N'-diacetyllegionaminate synthase
MIIQIGKKQISKNSEPFIIAEVGINHNGEIEKALQMIEIAKEAGADCVKFQTFKADEFIGDQSQMFTYNSQGKEVTESMLTMFKRYEFSKDVWKLIKQKCVKEDIIFMSTPQNQSDLEILLDLDIPAIKIGSDDFTNIPLLKEYAITGLPLIVSMGMSDLAEIYESLNAIGTFDGYPTILLLCTSQYPTPPEDVNLLKLRTLTNTFPNLILGFSDHTQGFLASSLAVAMGAKIFEKHFTLSHDLPGPDHWFSETPDSLRTWVNSIKTSHLMLGNELLKPTEREMKMRTLARRSVVILKDIKAGELLSKVNLGLRRPGNGIAPNQFEKIIGSIAISDLKKGFLLKYNDFR